MGSKIQVCERWSNCWLASSITFQGVLCWLSYQSVMECRSATVGCHVPTGPARYGFEEFLTLPTHLFTPLSRAKPGNPASYFIYEGLRSRVV